jgi:hypothetical protein
MTSDRVPPGQHLHTKWMEGCVEPQHSREFVQAGDKLREFDPKDKTNLYNADLRFLGAEDRTGKTAPPTRLQPIRLVRRDQPCLADDRRIGCSHLFCKCLNSCFREKICELTNALCLYSEGVLPFSPGLPCFAATLG